jgi:predicted NUDIX family phosphoesterase
MVLVVKKDEFLKHNFKQGFKIFDDNFLEDDCIYTILNKKEFKPRSMMELDENYKQIIPYIVFKYNDKVFLMQRSSNSTESRLKDKFTFGIGGHLNPNDIKGSCIFNWAKREFEEEVSYNGNYSIRSLGVINDELTSVGRVHLGFVIMLIADSDDIKVKSELKSGKLYKKDECQFMFDKLEQWSQMIFQYIF